MIQRANDPNASRGSWRPAANDDKAQAQDARRSRSGHAWPFLSPHAARSAQPERPRQHTSNDSGS